MTTIAHPELDGLDRYTFGWADSDVAEKQARRWCTARRELPMEHACRITLGG